MTPFIGIKVVKAEPMTHEEFINSIGERKTLAGEGYKIEYEDGYTSWCPKDAFEGAYQPVKNTNEGNDLRHMFMDMCSPDWQDRTIGEIIYLKNKTLRLKEMLEDYADGALGFKPNCSLELLTMQYNAMQNYLMILMLRRRKEKLRRRSFQDEVDNAHL